VINTVLSLALCVGMLMQALYIRKVIGTWLFPAAIYSLFWATFTIAPILINLDAPINPLAILYIFSTTIMFSAGSVRFNWQLCYATARNTHNSREFSNSFITTTLISVSIIASGSHLINMVTQGFSLSEIANNTSDIAAAYTEKRYGEDIVQNIFNQVGIVLTYIAAIFGGFLFLSRQGALSSGGILALSFAPSLFLVLAQSAKGAVFLSIALFLGAVAVYLCRTGEKLRISRLTATYIGIFISIALISVIFSFLARLGSSATSDYLVRYIVSYSSSHIFALSDWFSWYTGAESISSYRTLEKSYGFYTFMAIFKIMGDTRWVPLGTYDEIYEYSFYLTGNIYTIFRGLIIDFGIGGSVFAVLLFSFVTHHFFRIILISRTANFSIAFSVFVFGAIYHSYLSSITMYLSMYIMILIVWALMVFNSLFLARADQSDRPLGYETAQ
jgi:oligosaccharide repeat unit polymerase